MSRFKFCPQCTKPLVLAQHGEMPRLGCSDVSGCGFVLWDNPVPVVAAIVEHEGEIVLARNAAWPPGMFALITGFLEKHDPHPESGVLREVKEELGLDGRVAEFVGFYPFERMNQLIIAYHVIATGTIRLNEELVEFKKLHPEKIRLWPAGTGYAMRDWIVRHGYTPQPFDRRFLGRIRNFHVIDERLLTGGQPTAEELHSLQECGVQTVINLALITSDHALADERSVVESLGMKYVHIPVVWEAPTAANFETFCQTMDAERAESRTVFVHCAANKRVSAFVFLYRVLNLGLSRDRALPDLLKIWQPDALWQAFIDEQLRTAQLSS
jgi:protein tyrosine phosphatase (PTP) superfamily phosphohydrolase (DUF442 family)/8-oxo-dGTP pyrophosphatase MutT (NUDIX family)